MSDELDNLEPDQPDQPFRPPTPDELPQSERSLEIDGEQPFTSLPPDVNAALAARVAAVTGIDVDQPPAPAMPAAAPPAFPREITPEVSAKLSQRVAEVTGINIDDPGSSVTSPVTGRPIPPRITMEELEQKFPGIASAVEIKGWDDLMDEVKSIKSGVSMMQTIMMQGAGNG